MVESVAGCPALVEVLFDGRGVPHVYSGSQSALWFTQGFLHARDRFFQMDLARRSAVGRLSEIFGEMALENDRKMRTLRLAVSARRQVALLSSDERRALDNYTAGVNAAIDRYGRWIAPEVWLLGVDPEPWSVEQSLAIGLLIQLDLSWGMGKEIERAMELDRLGRDVAVDLWGWSPSEARRWIPPGEGISLPVRQHEALSVASGGPGANSWAVSPQRSATGRPLLANDPHLFVSMPGSFYAIHLSGTRLHVAGVSVAGLPGVIIGHTEGLAWGLTLSMLDDQDLFLLTLDDSGTRELVDGRWQPLRTVTEDIGVRWQPDPVLVKVQLSEHGPLVREQRGESLALSWSGYHGPSIVGAMLGMNRAQDIAEAASAWQQVVGPSVNLIAADTSGHILHRLVGKTPDRGKGAGRLPSPGNDSDWAWRGFAPLSEGQQVIDPAAGFVVSANHDVFDEGVFAAAGRFPADFEPPWRARRIRGALAARDDWSVDATLELQGDVISGRAIAILKQLRPFFEEHGGPTARALMTWDAGFEAGSVEAALFAEFMLSLEEAVGGDESRRHSLDWSPVGSEKILRLLVGGLDEIWWDDVNSPGVQSKTEVLSSVLDRMDESSSSARWGDLHRVKFQHPMSAFPGIGRLMAGTWNRGPYATGGSNVTVNAHNWRKDRPFAVSVVPALRFVCDVGEWDRTVLGLAVGQSGRPWSAHYSNQIGDWLRVEAAAFPFSRTAVEEAAVASLELIPDERVAAPMPGAAK